MSDTESPALCVVKCRTCETRFPANLRPGGELQTSSRYRGCDCDDPDIGWVFNCEPDRSPTP